MKKFTIFTAALALMASASCVKETIAPETVTGDGASFTATRADYDATTKTVLVDGCKVEWKANNQILVFGKGVGSDKDDTDTGSETFNAEAWKSAKWFTTSTRGTSVRFVCTEPEYQFDPSNEYIMLHPAGGNYFGLCTDDAMYMRFWLSDQTATRGTYDEAYGYCAAKASDFSKPVVFKNLLPLLKFTVPASLDGRINKITVTSNNRAEDGYVAGNMICNYTGDDPVVNVFSEFKSEYAYKGGKDNVSLRLTKKDSNDKIVEDTESGMAAGDYYLAIAPKTYSQGITITVRYKDGKTSTRKSSSSVDLKSGVIYNMGNVGAENYSGPGVAFPYVFSLYGSGTKDTPKYITKKEITSKTLVQWYDKDSEAVLEAKSTGSWCGYWSNKYWGFDNLICWYFNNTDTYFMLSVPLRGALPAKFRVTFGHTTEPTHDIIKDWKVQYSKDKEIWHDGATYQYERFLKYYSCELTTENETFIAGETLYLRWIPYGNASWTGGTTTGDKAQVQLTSGIVITDVVSPDSEASGNVYAEDFDRINGGVDYRHAGQTNGIEKLGLLGEVSGDIIDNWTDEQKNGLSGSYVAERPGYVQIGCITCKDKNNNDSRNCEVAEVTNHVGSLLTPVMTNASGTINLSFKAMCYRSPFLTGRTDVSRKLTDVTDIVVNIKGAGSFEEASDVKSMTLSGISTSKFDKKSLPIYNSDATTQIEFTSTAVSGKFTRWFLDDICVNK